jgi:DNA replication and repair protein RecF
MYLTRLSLTNFRTFTRLDAEIPKRVILVTGDNAQGKTTILEAIYFLAAFTSFQTHADRHLVNLNAARDPLAVARLVAEYKRGVTAHRLEIRLILEPVGTLNGQRLRKEILLDGVKRPPADAIGHFNAVIFVPQMTQIVEGAPEDRRRYLNLALAQTTPGYARMLGEYSQALTQRNALLKNLGERNGDHTQLEFWDETLARTGAAIIFQRIRGVQEISDLAAGIHNQLTHGSEVLRLNYQPAYDPLPRAAGQMPMDMDTIVDRSGITETKILDGFRERLATLHSEEIARGVTTIGPHRDEIRFLANTRDLEDYGSRGQVRTTLLSLKMAEVEWMKQKTGQWPVLLLDEVLVELDLQRRADLQSYLKKMEQALITTTDLNLFSANFLSGTDIWETKDGAIQVRENGGS